MYVFIKNERSGVHHAQEYENRFWTIFAILLSTALFFAKDSPLAFGRWNASLGFMGVLFCGYGMHAWDRYIHRKRLSQQVYHPLKRRTGSTSQSLVRLKALGIPIQDQLAQINSCLSDIDQLLIPSTINNFINQRFILRKEREIISTFEEADPRALNYLIAHSRLGLIFYKIKDHRNFSGQHRTELIELLAVEKISQLTVISRVIVLHALQIMKLPANTRAEYWVRNIILNTRQDDLSELKTLTDAKGDYFCMNKLIFDDIRSETVRQDLLNHFQKEARVQQAHMKMKTKKAKIRSQKAWRKVLSDVDDTLTCSAGSYPAGIDKRYGKKVVYPGVLGFYRELDLGTHGPEEWPSNTVGNLVFLSARPHVYKDVSEKQNFAKFAKLHDRRGPDGRGGMHTIPSLLPGDLTSGTEFIMKNDYEPLAVKKFENFKRYVSIYPEFKHVFVCDNGQGDVRAGEMMFDSFPNHVEAVYVHLVQKRSATYGYSPDRWKEKGFKPIFCRTYPEAALDAVKRPSPLIRISGFRRICQDAVADFFRIQTKQWPSQKHKWDRRDELNQSLWQANEYLLSVGEQPIELIPGESMWKIGERVRTPYGIGKIIAYRSIFDTYEVELDWRPLDVQRKDHFLRNEKDSKNKDSKDKSVNDSRQTPLVSLETVLETEEEEGEDFEFERSNVKKNLKTSTEENTVNEILSNPPSNDRSLGDDFAKNSTLEIDEVLLSPKNVDDNVAKSNLTKKSKTKKSCEATPLISTIQGRQISKYTIPELPTFPKDEETRSVFSFWTASSDTGKNTKSKAAFKTGDNCSTPFGAAIVKEYREDESIVVVDFTNWSARAYLQEKDIKIGGSGFFSSLFKRALAKDTDKTPTKEIETKEIEIQYVKGSVIETPFGTGVIVKPLPLDNFMNNKISYAEDETLDGSKISGENTFTRQKNFTTNSISNETIGISLTSWVLANKSNPSLYCTVTSLKQWKQTYEENRSKADTGGILSVFGNIVSQSIQLIKRQPERKSSVPTEIIVPREEQYYKDGAAITTLYGDGIVTSYRDSDGIYVISLNRWGDAKCNSSTIAYLRKDCLSHRIAHGCHEGYPVLTSLGLTGILASVEPSTGVHIVTISTAGMVCYLQPQFVIGPLKAAVGEDVLTPYGEGKMIKYRSIDNVYQISLLGTDATLFCKGESFDRAQDSLKDEESFGLKYLLRYFFSDGDKNDGKRSRSNSVGSLSATRSLSGRSIL